MVEGDSDIIEIAGAVIEKYDEETVIRGGRNGEIMFVIKECVTSRSTRKQ